MSDSDFDDDDDHLLQALMRGQITNPATPNHSTNTDKSINHSTNTSQSFNHSIKPNDTHSHLSHLSHDAISKRVLQAEGEVAILRAQLQQLQEERRNEVVSLKSQKDTIQSSTEKEISQLRATVQKLEDEKRFLDNELKTRDRRSERVQPKLDSNSSDLDKSKKETLDPKIIRISDDSAILISHLWNHCIVGSHRTSFSYLNKICVDFDLEVGTMRIARNAPVLSAIIEFLMKHKGLRLDELVAIICTTLADLVSVLVARNRMLSVPFLLSLVYCTLTFRPSAVAKSLVVPLLKTVQDLASRLSVVLESTEGFSDDAELLLSQQSDEEKFLTIDDKTFQESLLENYAFVCCYDIIERIVTTASMHPDLIPVVWSPDVLSVPMLTKCLPENSERIKSSTQINIVYNYIEMLTASVSESSFGVQDTKRAHSLLNSLLKFFFIDISIKDHFMFYGLNRVIGNNCTFAKIEALVPVEKDLLNNYLVHCPMPIPMESLSKPDSHEQATINFNHELHSLTLKLRIGNLLESYIVANGSVAFFTPKESFKLLIRIIGFEQNAIWRFPRSRLVSLRLQIIAIVVRIIFFMTQETPQVNSLMFPETMYELFVVMSRIAFGSDSLTRSAAKLLTKVRSSGYLDQPVFNHWAESKAKEINHLAASSDPDLIAAAECDFPNGLEFPYEETTIELSREILNLFVNHEEADNLYFNMNCQDEEV